MSKILKKCDGLSDQRKTVSEGQLGELLETLKKGRRKRPSNRTEANETLFKSLAVGLSLAYCGTGSPNKARRLNKLLDKSLDKEVRAGTREAYPIVQLCVPNKHRRDYNRYADAVSIAIELKLSPTEFFQELTDGKGGMSGFIKRGSVRWSSN